MKRKRIIKYILILLLLLVLIFAGVWFVRSGRWKKLMKNIEYSDTVILDGVEPISQYPDYPSGSECVSLCMLLRYYGVDVTVDGIISEMPQGPAPYDEDGVRYGANPEKEFVGSPYESDSFGVFNAPVSETAEKFRSGAVTTVNASIEDIIEIIDGGNPVIAWCSKNFSEIEYTLGWKDHESGEEILWASGEHAVVVYGHEGRKYFYIADPFDGSSRTVSIDVFETGFRQLGGRIVFYGNME